MSTECATTGIFLVSFVPSLLLLILCTYILIISIKQFQNEQKTKTTLKVLYYIAFTLGTIIILFIFIDSCICIAYGVRKEFPIMIAIIGAFYEFLAFCVLGTLLLRIYFSFKGSIFNVTKCQKRLFISLYILTGLCLAASMITYRIVGNPDKLPLIWKKLYHIVTWLGTILYFTGCIIGMYLFAKKMYKLAKLKGSDNGTKLNRDQLRLLYTTSKYISLLSLAVNT